MILVLILAVGLALRVACLFEQPSQPTFSNPLLDPLYHDYWARTIAFGHAELPNGVGDPMIDRYPYLRPPGYPFFLAGIYRLCGTDPYAPRIVQMGLGLITAWLGFLFARRWFGSRIALVFAAMLSFSWVFIYYELTLHAPTPLVFLSILLVILLGRIVPRLETWPAFAAGVILGLQALIRPNVLTTAGAILVWILWMTNRRRERARALPLAAAFMFGLLAMIAPATIRNYRVTGDVTLISANGGINLFFGNNPLSDGVSASHPEIGAWSCFDYPRLIRDLEIRLGKTITHADADAYYSSRAFRFVREDPRRAIALTLSKFQLFWSPNEVANFGDIHEDRRASRVLSKLPMPFALTLALGLTGLVMFFTNRRSGDNPASPSTFMRDGQLAMVVLLILLTLVHSITLTIFIVSGRYRVPIQPIVMLGAAYALVGLYDRLVHGDVARTMTWAWLVLGLLVATLLMPTAYRPSPAGWQHRRAVALQRAGDWHAAEEALRLALETGVPDARLHSGLGKCLMKLNRVEQAMAQFEKAIALDAQLLSARIGLGKALVRLGDTDGAMHQFTEAHALSPSHDEVFVCLGGLHAILGNREKAEMQFQEALKTNPARWDAHLLLGQIAREDGRGQVADKHFREVLRLDPDNAEARAGLTGESLPSGE